MNLMKDTPECAPVTKAVPPIEDERPDKPGRSTFENGLIPFSEVEERDGFEDSRPQSPCDDGNGELRTVHNERSRVPPTSFRQFATG